MTTFCVLSRTSCCRWFVIRQVSTSFLFFVFVRRYANVPTLPSSPFPVRLKKSCRHFRRNAVKRSSTCWNVRTEKWTASTPRVEVWASAAWGLWTSPKKTTDESGLAFRLRVLFTSTRPFATSTVTNAGLPSLLLFVSLLDIASSTPGVHAQRGLLFCETWGK